MPAFGFDHNGSDLSLCTMSTAYLNLGTKALVKIWIIIGFSTFSVADLGGQGPPPYFVIFLYVE